MPRSVSVVIPTHLRSGIVADAIESVAAQTVAPCELIVVSDVDDPDAERVVQEYARRLPFPTRFLGNREAPGVCGSRNLGAAAAQGEWIAFLDDDDVWYPNFLQELLARAQLTGSDFVLAGIIEQSEARGRRERCPLEGLTPQTFFSVPGGMTGSSLLIRRSTFLELGGFDPRVRVFNDWDLFFRLVSAGAAYAVVRRPLVEWRQHEGSRIGTASLHRAAGLEFFVERYRYHLPPRLRRDLLATAAGIRRRQATGVGARVMATLALARAHGVSGLCAKLMTRKESRS